MSVCDAALIIIPAKSFHVTQDNSGRHAEVSVPYEGAYMACLVVTPYEEGV